MSKKIKEKEVIIKLYNESLNDIIWTHKIQATLLEYFIKSNKKYKTIKEVIIGLSGFISAICIYFDEITGALIVNALSSLTVILDGIFKFSNYDEKIKTTNVNVNELWYMKKDLTYFKDYLKNDMITWKEAKEKLEEALKQRKEIYSKLEPAPKKVIEEATSKLLDRKDEEINKEFFDESE